MKNKNEIDFKKVFKKIFKNNEIVIYAIALMLVTAGYFNYTANLEDPIQVSSNEAKENINEEKTEKNKNENSEQTKSETQESKEKTIETAVNNTKEIEENENKNETGNEKGIGDAKLVNSTDVIEDDYFAATKLDRDTNYANSISTYKIILEDKNISETQKGIAMTEIKKINDTQNAISVAENLLSTKDLENYVVLANNDSINVIIKSKGEFTKAKVAQIQNIISREFKCEIENIHITEKK